MSPAYLSYCNRYKSATYYAYNNHFLSASCDSNVDNNYAVRPAITLVNKIRYKEGNGYRLGSNRYWSGSRV